MEVATITEKSRVNIWLPNWLKDEYVRIAKQADVSTQSAIIIALKSYLENGKKSK